MALYDPCAAVAVVDPDRVMWRPARIDIELQRSLTRGRTVVEARLAHAERFNAHYAESVDAEYARKIILGALEAEASR